MFRSSVLYGLSCLIALICASCSHLKKQEDAKNPVASVGDVNLYEEDLAGIYTTGISPEDSMSLRLNYIDNWVKDEIIFQKALKSLPDSLKNKEDELENYYRSLIRYAYEKEVINRQLDTSISLQEIHEYYTQYEGGFELRRPVCRSAYIVLAADVPKLSKVKEWFKDESPENLDSLDRYCLTYATKFQLDRNKWMYVDDIKVDLAVESEMMTTWFESGNTGLYEDSVKTVFFKLHEKRGIGEPSPLSLERKRIRGIIKNKKKVEFIANLEKNIFETSLKNGEFEIYE